MHDDTALPNLKLRERISVEGGQSQEVLSQASDVTESTYAIISTGEQSKSENWVVGEVSRDALLRSRGM